MGFKVNEAQAAILESLDNHLEAVKSGDWDRIKVSAASLSAISAASNAICLADLHRYIAGGVDEGQAIFGINEILQDIEVNLRD
jgi:hypothetical protein